MSFGFDVKKELCRVSGLQTADLLAELCGMVLFGQAVEQDYLKIVTENVLVINRLQQLSTAVQGVFFAMDETVNAYTASLHGEPLHKLYRLLQLMDGDQLSLELSEGRFRDERRFQAFLRGAMLSGGYFSDPQKEYHFELGTPYHSLAGSAKRLFMLHGMTFKSTMRRSNYVLYMKDGQCVHNALYLAGARAASFALMNVMVEKENTNYINRRENCDSSNAEKSINKAVEQVFAIGRVQRTIGLAALPADLREVAELRLAFSSASLAELVRESGGRFSRSGLSRKLNRIVEIASACKE